MLFTILGREKVFSSPPAEKYWLTIRECWPFRMEEISLFLKMGKRYWFATASFQALNSWTEFWQAGHGWGSVKMRMEISIFLERPSKVSTLIILRSRSLPLLRFFLTEHFSVYISI